jgi:hypothetical protein
VNLERWVEYELAYLEDHLTLYCPEVAGLLAATIGVLFLAALGVIVL